MTILRGFANVFSGLLQPIASVGVGLILTPLIISRMGMEAYSYWPLCNSLTLYVGLITVALTSSVRRETVYALDRDDLPQARIYFNTGLVLMLGFWVIVVTAGMLACLQLQRIVVLKSALAADVRWMFVLTMLATSLDILASLFFVGAYSCNRIYVEKSVVALTTLGRLVFVTVSFGLFGPSLRALGWSALAASALAFIISVGTCRRYMPQVTLHPLRYTTRPAMFALAHYGKWLLIAAIGVYLFQTLQLVLANRLLSPEHAGRYGIVIQVVGLFVLVAGHVGYILSRKLITYISCNDHAGANVVFRRYYVWILCGLTMPGAMLFADADALFAYWLKGHAAGLGALLRVGIVVSLVVQPMSLFNTPLLISKRLRTNAVASILLVPCLIVLSYVLTRGLGWGLSGLLVAAGIAMLFRNIVLLVDAWRHCGLLVTSVAYASLIGSVNFFGVLLIVRVRQWLVPGGSLLLMALDTALAFGVGIMLPLLISNDCRLLVKQVAPSWVTGRNLRNC